MPAILTDDETKDRIRKFEVLIDEAQKQGADVGDARKSLKEAADAFIKGNSDDAYDALLELRGRLSQSVRNLRRLYRYSYVFAIYGLWPILYAIVWFIMLGALVLFGMSSIGVRFPSLPFAVPAWAALVGGIGACVQIYVSVVADVKDDGVVTGARRDWYIVVPFASLVFGVISYMLVQIGLLSLGSGASTSSGSAGVNSTYLLFIIAFLSGYSTDWFMGKLADLTKGGSSTKS